MRSARSKARSRASRRRNARKVTRKLNKKRNPKGQIVSRSLGLGFPKRITMKHRYTELINFAPTVGNFATYTFIANSMYDPNYTGTGHQPMYFDQMTALYNHYTVIGSKITITFVPTSDSVVNGNIQVIVGCIQQDNTTVTQTSITELQEFGGKNSYKFLPAGQTDPYKISKSWSAKKTFGGSILANTDLQGNSGSSPFELSTYTFYVYNANNTYTAYFQANVDVEYIAVWSELKDLAGS